MSSSMKSLERVREYFDREAVRFDAIYEEQKPGSQQLVDRLFRKVVVERFRLICNLAPYQGPWTVLDVGCGSGRYSLALAREGATRVVGVDVAPSMIALATEEAAKAGASSVCEFHTSAFLDFKTDEKFDVVVATGYFDYLENPVPHLKGMKDRCRGRIFFSIPKRWEWRVPIRKARFAFERGYVRFYSRGELDSLIAAAGIAADRASVIDLGRDYIVVVNNHSRG